MESLNVTGKNYKQLLQDPLIKNEISEWKCWLFAALAIIGWYVIITAVLIGLREVL